MVYKFQLPTVSLTERKRLKDLSGSLISVSGLVGRKIINQDLEDLGSLVELVCHWDNKEIYPPLSGIIAKVARRQVWIPIDNIKLVSQSKIILNSAKLDLREFKIRPGEARLIKEVLDHQLIDVDGARVVRASDLYLAFLGNKFRLVGVDVGFRSLIKRIGPNYIKAKARPDRVIDWATIESFGEENNGQSLLRLSANRQELRKMRPGELADMLEDLGRPERQELLNVLSPDLAADALEEMEPKELEGLIRETTPDENARYLSKMEPDEAADALRDIEPDLRIQILSLMNLDNAKKIKKVLDYEEETAGGIMNTLILTAKDNAKVSEIKNQLRQGELDLGSLNSLIIVDKKDKLIYDLPLANLIKASNEQQLKELIKPPDTVTTPPEASLKEVAELLVESRSSSIVVVDKHQIPIGRIQADDLLDVLLPQDKFHFPRLLSS